MKRILIGLTYYYPNISGVSEYVKTLAEELVKSNKVEIICSKHNNNLLGKENLNGVKITRLKGWQFGKGFLMWQYPIVSFKAVKRNEIINCHLPSMEAFWLAIWAKLLGKKLIITHHCEFVFNGNFSNKIIALLSFPSHFFTYLLADTIVSYTQDYASKSIFLRIFSKKNIYILPPIKLEKASKEYDFGNGKIVGYVGRIAWEKGLTYLIEAMKSVKAKLVLVGPYSQVIGDKTYDLIKNNLNEKIVLIGAVEHKNLEKIYKKIDCLVLPSINNLETFGIVQAEAMKCGVPVVASDLPGVRIPIRMTGMGEICKIKNAKDLAEKINLVLKNGKKYYQKISKNLDKFDYKKTAAEYEKIF